MPLDHPRQEPAAQVDHGGHVHLDEVKFFLWNRFRDESERRQPGVVDQDVGDKSQRGDPVQQGRPVGSVGQVGGQRVRLRAQPPGELFKAVDAAGYQHDLVATPGKYLGEFLTDA